MIPRVGGKQGKTEKSGRPRGEIFLHFNKGQANKR